MARTTLDLDPAVLRELRRLGALEGKSMSQVASELLAQAIAGSADSAAPGFQWISSDLGTPMIDLEDPEAIRRV